MPNDFHTVSAPDGKTINFPVSMEPAEIQAAMQKLYPPTQPSGGGATIGEQLAAKGGPYAALAKATGIGPQPSTLQQLQAGNVPGLDQLADAMQKVGTPQGAGLPQEGSMAGRIGQTLGMLTKNPAAQSLFSALSPELANSAIPNAGRAAANLNDVRSSVGSLPVDVEKLRGAVGDLVQNESTGGTLPPAVKKLVTRVAESGPNNPLTYADAKDFQSNITSLTASDKMTTNPNTKRLVSELNQQLKGVLQETADVWNKGDLFADAMKEYHQAMQMAGLKDAAIGNMWKAALAAGGGGALYKMFH